MTDNELIEMYGKMAIALDQLEHCREFGDIIPEVRLSSPETISHRF
jgi:hypothetical protein